jgi:1-carboxybiuret hydrolase subunit AtzG-like protein
MEAQDRDSLIEAQARALGLALEPSWKPAVCANLDAILRFAAMVDAFPLPDDAEPAPIFRA